MQLNDHKVNYAMVYIGQDLNNIPSITWEKLGRSKLVKTPVNNIKGTKQCVEFEVVHIKGALQYKSHTIWAKMVCKYKWHCRLPKRGDIFC